jgi:hypothetical protein
MDIFLKALAEEKSSLNKFRYATMCELKDRVDDVCPVCLLNMKWKAKVTPCNHFFHTDCLRRCLKQNNRDCPFCKQDLLNFQ